FHDFRVEFRYLLAGCTVNKQAVWKVQPVGLIQEMLKIHRLSFLFQSPRPARKRHTFLPNPVIPRVCNTAQLKLNVMLLKEQFGLLVEQVQQLAANQAYDDKKQIYRFNFTQEKSIVDSIKRLCQIVFFDNDRNIAFRGTLRDSPHINSI